MTINHHKLAGFSFATLFVFAVVAQRAAGEDSANGVPENSMLEIIAPAQENGTTDAKRTVWASDLVLREVEPAAPPARAISPPAEKKPAQMARGDLQVVSNASRKPVVAVAETAPPAPVAEFAPTAKQPEEEPAEKPAPVPQLNEPPQVVATALPEPVLTEPTVVAGQKAIEKTKPQVSQAEVVRQAEVAQPVDPVGKLLVQANTLSQQATTEAQFGDLMRLCAKAIQMGAEGEGRAFAKQLAAWSLNRRGQLRADRQEPELALEDFEAALSISPNHWRALHNRGVSRAQAGQFADAFDDFDLVIQLNPNFAKAYSNRATLFVQAKNLSEAIADFERAIQLDPNLAAGQIGLGRVCHMLGRLEEALEHVDQAVQIDPDNADMVCSRGDLQTDMGNYGDAMVDYALAIDLNPECAHAYRNGSWLLATCPDEEIRDGENALLGAQKAIEFGYGQRHVALDTLAASLANLGRFEEAIVPLQEAIELAPWKARSSYRARLRLYENQTPFRTQPVGVVSQAEYQEEL